MKPAIPTGHVLIAKFKGFRQFENKDENGRIMNVSKSYSVHVPYADGTVLPALIYFPRDPSYTTPSLQEDAFYAFPIEVRIKRTGKDLTYSARADLMPFPAPEAA